MIETSNEPGEQAAVVSCRDLTLRYGRKIAVDGVGFDLHQGTALALLGRNGAGKSTLVQSLLGLRPIAGGEISVFGLEPWKQRRPLMARIGAVLERPHLPADATLRSLVRYVSDLRPGLDTECMHRRIADAGLGAASKFGGLSRGQQTQVCLELALAPEPELIVLDDPLLGLDVVARAAILERLVETLAEREVTLLITSHDLDAVERLATHVGFLDQGRLTLLEDVEGLLARHRRIRDVADGRSEAGSLDLPWPTVGLGSGFGRQLLTSGYSGDAACPPGVSTEPLTLEEIFRLHADGGVQAGDQIATAEDAA